MAAVTGGGFFARAVRLADALPDGVIVVDAAGTVMGVNTRLEQMTGFQESELLATPIERLVGADRRILHVIHSSDASARPKVQRMGAERGIVCQRSDGSRFPADIAVSPVALDGQSYVVVTVHDATNGRAAEDARRETEERFRLLVESASGLAIFSLDTEGRVTSWNGGAERLKGYARNEIIGEHFSTFYTPADVAARRPARLLAEATAQGRAEDVGPRVRKDGSHYLASVSITTLTDSEGNLRGFTKIVRDNSAALLARDALERLHLSEQREHIGRDLHDGAIQAMFAVGMGLQALLPDVDNPAVTERLQEFVVALDDTMTELRGFIFGLNGDLTSRQVRGELERLVIGLRSRSGMTVALTADQSALAALDGKGRDLLLVAREALSNVERHARASRCVVALRRADPTGVELVVEDDGCGFDPDRSSGGLGLANARSRADEMGATYRVDSAPAGTTVTLRVPMPSFSPAD